MGKENFKILIRNLRIGKNAKLKIHSSASSVKFDKVGKSIRIQQDVESNNSHRK